jgi:VWFA-related protein
MKKRAALFVTVGWPLIVALGLWSRPQDRPQQQPRFHYEAEAIVKLVPVRVLGPDGRPVMDLRKGDFTLYEDGQKKTITEFEVHTITNAGLAVAPELPVGIKPAAAMNRKFFLFVDAQGSDIEGRQKAVAVAQRFLDTEVRPGDEVGLLGFYSMSGFFVREYLTTDIARVRRAIGSVKEMPPSEGEWVYVGVNDSVPVKSHIPDVGPDIPGGVGHAVFIPGTARFQHADFIPRLKEVAEVFKTIPGNKSLILFSSRRIGPEIGKLFGATGTAIYAINTQDWMAVGRDQDKVKHIWWEHPLKDMAAASGGRYFADINQVTAISQDLQALTGNFYVLGYYVKESWEGKYHKIRVEVARPNTRVLVQDGYSDAKPFAQMTDFEKDLQLLDLIWSENPISNPLPIATEILVPADGTSLNACFLACLDVGAKAGPPATKSEIVVLLRDKDGAQVLSRQWTVDLKQYDGRFLLPYLIAPVVPGACEARLVVRDLSSGEACVGRARFDVTAAPQEGVVLFSPLLLEPGPEAIFMGLPLAQKGREGSGERSLIDYYPLMPKNYHPVVSEMRAGTDRLVLILPFELLPAQPEDQPILSVGAKLFSRLDGAETSLKIIVRDHKAFEGKPDILVADIMLPAIVPGQYDLEITVEDIGTDRRASVREPLVIK